MKIRLLPALGAITAVSLAPVLASATASAAPLSAKALLSATKTAISHQKSVHLEVRGTSSTAKGIERIVVDAAAKQGKESITQGSASVALRLTPAYCYLAGNAKGLSGIFGLSSTQTKKIGKRWVSVKAGTSQYSALESTLLVSSVKTMLPTTEKTKLSRTTVHGALEYQLKWTTAAQGSTPALHNVMTISSGRRPLPISDKVSASSGTETISFSHWGEKVSVLTPPKKSVIAYTKVAG